MGTRYGFEFKVDINVINHLGVGLYSSTPAALTELVANAWDADASKVDIAVDPSEKTIVIEDDGHGMDAKAVAERFLKVGYSRRQSALGPMSASRTRRVMGRKGIGKLAMFALADQIEVSSQVAGGEAIGFKIDVQAFKAAMQAGTPMILEEFIPAPFTNGHGTRIALSQVLSSLRTSAAYLRVRLARRFTIVDDGKGFELTLNGVRVTRNDRGFYDKVQFLWFFDDETERAVVPLATNIEMVEADGKLQPHVSRLDDSISTLSEKIRGYVASVRLPKELGSKDDSANILSVFANERVFTENILPDVGNAMYYQHYLVGEIHADFLDADAVDRATASREAIKRDDPKYAAVLDHVRVVLKKLGSEWDAERSDVGLDQNTGPHQAVTRWLSTLTDERDRKLAKRLMSSIHNATIHADEQKNESSKGLIYRGAIVGFEKLRTRRQLDRLSAVSDVLGQEFAAIFASLQDVEETQYADITKQRLAVISKFDEIASDPKQLESVAQKFLFNHLWLLDPTWNRVSGRAEMEKTLTKYLAKEQPDSTGARLDISYRAGSGRHIVVELKRPARKVEFSAIFEQVSKYRDAVRAYYRDQLPDYPVPDLDIYILVSGLPVGFDEAKRRALAEVSGKFLTYSQMIQDAKNSYQEYLSANETTGELAEILKQLI